MGYAVPPGSPESVTVRAPVVGAGTAYATARVVVAPAVTVALCVVGVGW